MLLQLIVCLLYHKFLPKCIVELKYGGKVLESSSHRDDHDGKEAKTFPQRHKHVAEIPRPPQPLLDPSIVPDDCWKRLAKVIILFKISSWGVHIFYRIIFFTDFVPVMDIFLNCT